MGAETLLFKLTARGVALDMPGGGVSELSRMDVAAALGWSRYRDDGQQVRLGRMPYLWALHYICRDVATLSDLLSGLAAMVSPQREVAMQYASGLARVAVAERVINTVCRECFGGNPACRVCNGKGSRSMSKRRKAQLAGVAWGSWCRHEAELVMELDYLYRTLGDLQSQVESHLAAVCYEAAATV